jgi:CheY-like chemotaxis protein
LSNAIKFSDRGGRVAIRCEEDDAQVRVQVADDGQGIGSDFLPYVFDRFSQAEGQSRRSRTGLGLGLALVREMVQAHGGTVVAESPGAGRGSTFTVTLPLSIGSFAHGSHKTSAPQADLPESLPPIEILIVDDDGDVRELLALLLESRGASARTVSSASEALDAISQRRPHLLLADLRMPDEDGYSLIRRVRASERERHEGRLPAIAITAYASATDRTQAIAAGFDAHLPKPVEPADLTRAVAKVARGFLPKNEAV